MQNFKQAAERELSLKKQQAVDIYLAKRQPQLFFEQYTQALDNMLAALWQEMFIGMPMCLLAVGGFGRREMYPHSDLDLALVCAEPLTEAQQEAAALFVQTLWDMQLTPAVKIGSIEELCLSIAQDLTGETAFLEARFICGSHIIGNAILQRLSLERKTALFIEEKLVEMKQRHDKQQGSGALLEPNIKTCPGGLRDIHTMMWLGKAQGLSTSAYSLVHNRVLTRVEAGLLTNSHKQLARIRIDLHLAAGREEDRLVFDLQSKVAANMGLQDDEKRIKSEKLMHMLYRATKTVKQLNGIIIPMLRGRVYSLLPRHVHQIDHDYYQIGNQIAVKDKNIFHKSPTHIFKIIEIIQKRNDIKTIAPQTLRAWWAATRRINKKFYKNPVNRERFVGFFKAGNGLTHTMRLLNLYGVLGQYLPAWKKITGLLQHDLFHIYPVDDHILMVLRNMRRLAMDTHVHELPFASSLMHSFEKKYILYLAAMFHDIAKGRGGDHATEGIADARKFAADHFLNQEENDFLAWLVEDHLLMSMVAQKEDIYDTDVISRFCARVQTQERLTALYLLTVADIRGTNPKIWNSWKAGLLESLFHAASRHLAGGENNRSAITGHRQNSAAEALTQQGFDAKQQRRLWQALGAAYFVRHEEQEILWHLPLLIDHLEESKIAVRQLNEGGTLQVMIYMPNAPRLFTRLCRIFSHQGLDIVAARAFITETNYILDTFVVQFPAIYTAEDYPLIQSALGAELNDFLQGKFDEGDETCGISSRRVRHQPIAPTIQLTEEEDYPGWFILEIVTANRPYLLANITEAFAALDISLRYAKINTLDERVEDSFSLYSPSLANPKQQLELKRLLFEQLNV
ncbi:MAG: [protein-PII] uridylyltransferase [Neisseria sp.]|uniref:[protein-PII] uridylyltransferase n=1 Tax=Neisseria sp. TaxID=192066 RepID=UPI0026DC1CA5|nr:[protein-PII] uridylyltransferase [Neisseria sp.]MDO4640212.1 [protein-PII] uridylyltransferase [Neisseria sp.]